MTWTGTPLRRRRQVLLPLLLVLVGCTASPTNPEVETPPDQVDLVGRWQDRSGADVADGTDGTLTLSAFAASTSCSDVDATVFLDLAWPVGSRVNLDQSTSSSDHHSYVRDPHGLYWTDEQPDLDTELPSSARSSGLRRAGNELYVETSDASAVWVQRPDGHVERWPRQKRETGCA